MRELRELDQSAPRSISKEKLAAHRNGQASMATQSYERAQTTGPEFATEHLKGEAGNSRNGLASTMTQSYERAPTIRSELVTKHLNGEAGNSRDGPASTI